MGESEGECVRLTADVVLTAPVGGVPHVLLIRRGKPPFRGVRALPGGHVDPGERVEVAAARELVEETGVTVDRLRLVGCYSAPGRDPRGWYVSAAYAAELNTATAPTAGDDAAVAEWVPVERALADGLAFDHSVILRDATGGR